MGYYPNPYFGRDEEYLGTYAARELAERDRKMREAYGNEQIYWSTRDMHELRHRVDLIDKKLNDSVRTVATNKSVEVIYEPPSRLSRFWKAFIESPFWEFAKRPSLR